MAETPLGPGNPVTRLAAFLVQDLVWFNKALLRETNG